MSGDGKAIVQPLPATGPDLVGFVDAIADGRIYGWAWSRSRPDAPLDVVVQAGGAEIGRLVADRARSDLESNGIGNGRHAFEFNLPDGVAPAAVAVQACCPVTGTLVPLRPAPSSLPAAAGEAAALDRLEQTLSRVHDAQRMLLRVTQNGLAAVRDGQQREAATPTPDFARLVEQQEALGRQIASLEVFLVRLDASLQAMSEAHRRQGSINPPNWVAPALAGLGALALLSIGLQLVAMVG